MKVGRNQSCPCGSGKKFKRCHGSFSSKEEERQSARALAYERHVASEAIRARQQGKGRPIISVKMGEHQVVAVRNKLYSSKKWKTFPDFLSDYIKRTLGADWGNAELQKPIADRHPILQWYDEICRQQAVTITNPGEIASAPVTGAIAAYYGLAYGLYLLDHNVELQQRLVKRLKNTGNFQGAYFEVLVASALIRSGFDLFLEDEENRSSKHCEFYAVNRQSGKRYSVEVKTRAVAGVLGKSEKDGTTDANPLSEFIPHLNSALSKPSTDQRLIFIDLNAEPEAELPSWIEHAARKLEKHEKIALKNNESAYVFVSNIAFHRALKENPRMVLVPLGLGIPDFNKVGSIRIVEKYKNDQKHREAIEIAQSFQDLVNFPSTFDGALPSEAHGQSRRILIGETYHFEGIGESEMVATVTTSTVDEEKGVIYIGVTDQRGKSHILTQPMTKEELQDYKNHSDAYFGKLTDPPSRLENDYDLFCWFMKVQKDVPTETILRWFSNASDLDRLKSLTREDLLLEYCERLVAATQQKRKK
jgi:hypothetical protein